MSCKHGNWPPCDECDADDVLYMRIQNLENECADWTKGYGLLFKQNGQLRDLIELMFSSTMPYDKSGQPTFSDAIVNLWSNLNQVDSEGPSACYDEPQPAPAAVVGPTNKVLWLLMAQYGLNMTVGQDMDNLLNFGRDVWNAALSATQPAPAAQADTKDAARWRYAVEIGGNQRMNWLDVYDDWDGDGSFADAIDAAMAVDKKGQS